MIPYPQTTITNILSLAEELDRARIALDGTERTYNAAFHYFQADGAGLHLDYLKAALINRNEARALYDQRLQAFEAAVLLAERK